MARQRELKRKRLIRNITILFGCLVVAVMFLERGMITSPSSSDATIINNNNNNNNNIKNINGGNNNNNHYDEEDDGYLQVNNNDDSLNQNGGGQLLNEDEDEDSVNINNNDDDVKERDDDENAGDDYDQHFVHDESESESENESERENESDKSESEGSETKVESDSEKKVESESVSKSEIASASKTESDKSESESESKIESSSHSSSSESSETPSSPSSVINNSTLPLSNSSSPSNSSSSEGYIDSEDDDVVNHPSSPSSSSSISSSEEEELDPAARAKKEKKEKEKAEKEKIEKKVWDEYHAELTGAKNATIVRNSSSLLLPKPLLFLHIPKTAGSTLAQVFKNNEEANKYKHFWNHPRLDDLPSVPTKETIFGHFRYGLHFYFENRTASYATFLREPVGRVISYYHFHLQDTQDPAHKFAVEHTFEEWLDESPAAQNEMTKCLSGIRSEFYPSEESFEMAKHHLKHKMGFVGLTERFSESLVLMKYYLGFTNLKFDNTKVGVKKPKEIPPEVIKKIRQKNWMDIELYEMAKKIFEDEMAEVGKYLLKKELGQ